MSPTTAAVLALLIGFLLGSIPTGYIAGRRLKGIDLREVGSGNLGATNVFRNLGLLPGLAVLVVDLAKGALAVWIGLNLFPALTERLPDITGLIAALGAVLGHSLSPWVGFQGGKGVATAAGGFFLLAPLPIAASLMVWGLVLGTTRVMSVASIAGAAVLPVTLVIVELTRAEGEERRWATLIFGFVVAVWIVWRHRTNLARLREGTECRLW
jgi:glycerol-3-phosphate acyltransferase PlsY